MQSRRAGHDPRAARSRPFHPRHVIPRATRPVPRPSPSRQAGRAWVVVAPARAPGGRLLPAQGRWRHRPEHGSLQQGLPDPEGRGGRPQERPVADLHLIRGWSAADQQSISRRSAGDQQTVSDSIGSITTARGSHPGPSCVRPGRSGAPPDRPSLYDQRFRLSADLRVCRHLSARRGHGSVARR